MRTHFMTSDDQNMFATMKRRFAVLCLVTSVVTIPTFAYDETDFAKLKALNECKGCDLSGADLIEDDLRGAKLRGANLSSAYLNGADLSGANLSGADLRKTNFSKSDLREVNLREADLREVNLREADLRGADLKGANLRGAQYCKTRMPSWEERNDHC